MAKPSEIKSEIERRVKVGEVKRGDIVKVPNLSEDYFILLKASFVGNKNYEMEEEKIINKNNPQERSYDLYLKYVGRNK